jgi:Asp/Glu/hydantoin racemase
MSTRIALIHAGPVSIEPVELAFQRLWPQAERVNIMDDALMVDRAKSPELTEALSNRILRLAAYGRDLGAAGILFTCSAFGPAIEEAQRRAGWPVLKPNEAMFEAALEKGRRIGLVASFQNSLPTMEAEFRALAQAKGIPATIRSACAPDALTALQRGDVDTHNACLARAAASLDGCDAILLAQFSTSRAAPVVQAAVRVPVMTAPDTAVTKIKRLLANTAGSPGSASPDDATATS